MNLTNCTGTHVPAGGNGLDVVCIGSPLMDLLAFADYGLLDQLGVKRGTMSLVDLATTEKIAARIPPERAVSGGTVANTAAGLASFGARAVFVGAVATDELGDRYRDDLEKAGVSAMLEQFDADGTDEAGTGRCYVVITPDAERTMLTALGVSSRLDPEGLPSEVIGSAAFCYFDGYVLDFPDASRLVDEVVALSRAGGTKIAFGLADPFVVDRHRETILELLDGSIDLLFGNEEEMVALHHSPDLHAALERLRPSGLMVVATRGADGAIVVEGEEEVSVPAYPVDAVVDATGAGDLFTAGVLFGMSTGRSLLDGARLGALAASEVIGHLGARPERSLAELAQAVALA